MERFPTTIKNIAHLSKLEHDPPIFVKALNPVVVGVNHNDVVLCVEDHTARLDAGTMDRVTSIA